MLNINITATWQLLSYIKEEMRECITHHHLLANQERLLKLQTAMNVLTQQVNINHATWTASTNALRDIAEEYKLHIALEVNKAVELAIKPY
jgi:hypothetical protein